MAWDFVDPISRVKPLAHFLEAAYEDYKITPLPMAGGPENQCAIRMSVALDRCGFSFNLFNGRDPTRTFTLDDKEFVYTESAESLYDYLRKMWGKPRIFKSALRQVPGKIGGKHGVIYFNNIFTRTGSNRKIGDHIDCWNGTKYYNDIIHADNNGAYFGDGGNFVSFFELS